MTEEKPAKDDAVEKNGVEPDKPPTRKLAVLIAVLAVLVVLAIVGLWRLLIYQTRIERELKANPETAEVKELNKQNRSKLQTEPMFNPKTGTYTVPIDHAMKLIASDPRRLEPAPLPKGAERPGRPKPAAREAK